MKLTDYTKMKKADFWKLVDDWSKEDYEQLLKDWEAAGSRVFTEDEAVDFLDRLFLDSHSRMLGWSKAYKTGYPTKQFTRNRLAKRKHLWWVDHYTAGISHKSTLRWFSANKRKNENGQMIFNGASTHFVQPYHGLPFYIIPLMHGAWHEPRRNKDAISEEFVNAGEIRKHGDNWCYWPKGWTQELPENLVKELPPLTFDVNRRQKSMQPFTQEQLTSSIRLKRIVNAALPGLLDDSRMSQHSDWRDGKSDMGPLFPLEDINDCVGDGLSIDEMAFIDRYEDALDEIGDFEDVEIDEYDNPEFGVKEPTHDDDDKEPKILRTKEVQTILANLSYAVDVDGLPGKKTRGAIRIFQATYNNEHGGTLTVDGIAGPRTCIALRKMRGEE